MNEVDCISQIENLFPWNLMKKVFQSLDGSEFYSILGRVYVQGVIDVLNEALTDKERHILLSHYQRRMTLEEIGSKLYGGVTKEHIRQVESEAIMKLTASKNVRRCLYALPDEYEALRNENIAFKAKLKAIAELVGEENLLSTIKPGEVDKPVVTIDSIGLSTRAYNRLSSLGIHTVDQLKKFSYEDLIVIDGIGKDSAMDIVQRAAEHGVIIRKGVKV